MSKRDVLSVRPSVELATRVIGWHAPIKIRVITGGEGTAIGHDVL
jgi:hypothetical protein